MTRTTGSCIKCVGDRKVCSFCTGKLIRHGFTGAEKLRYKCKSCSKTQVVTYTYLAYDKGINTQIIRLTKEGVDIRSIARILRISTTTLLKRLRLIAAHIQQPAIVKGRKYEVDEVKTYIGRKKHKIWIAYALERENKQVVSFNVGKRTNKTLRTVLKTLYLSDAAAICTDQYPSYRYLIPEGLHQIRPRCTNHIERMNLNLRTHLKRLNRRTICFSRSAAVLSVCLKIYFWG